ncbi:MAG: cytochrome C oxidase assembly protein [Bacteroidia bacterium]|nr:MAG: cytochrome C oxidase assembly protein [Bacteroidia bacterium]
MFETLSHLALQQYWWIIIALLGGILVFLMFVQGGQTFIFQMGKTETEKTLLVNSLGRKWEFTFTTLVTFGGAFFASFPLFYATSFGGAYWVWIAILFAFIVQAVSYEFRTKPNNVFGSKTYEVLLFINGLLATVLIGTAVGTFFNGANFQLDEMNFCTWQNSAYGLEAVLNFHNVALGLAVFFLSRVLGLLYFMNNIDNNSIFKESKKQLLSNSALFLVFFLTFVIWLLLKDGFAYNPETKQVFMEEYKYLHNLLQMPLNTLLFLVGVVGVLWGIFISLFKDSTKGIWFAGGGTILTVFALFILAGFNNTAFYPAFPFDGAISADAAQLEHFIQSSLTIENSSSSPYTLITMSYVSLLIPFVVAYIAYTWNAINSKKLDSSELEEKSHIY